MKQFEQEIAAIQVLNPSLGQYINEMIAKAMSLILPLPETTKFLKKILFDQVCGETDGTSIICDQGKIFPGNIDNDFKNWDLNKPSSSTQKTKFSVYELTTNGNGADIFNSFNRSLSELTFTIPQIIEIVKNNSSILHPEGNSTVFLTEKDGNFFQVDMWSGAPNRFVRVLRLENGTVWSADNRDRFVIPQHEPVKQ